MSDRERLLLQRLRAKVAERLPLARLVLFGSRARGDNEPDSDVDVLVVIDGSVSREPLDLSGEADMNAWRCIRMQHVALAAHKPDANQHGS